MVGVHKSDVLVILATKGVLTRPWCLLEMWEAALNEIPIVLFPVVGGDWTQDDACTLLCDLMRRLMHVDGEVTREEDYLLRKTCSLLRSKPTPA